MINGAFFGASHLRKPKSRISGDRKSLERAKGNGSIAVLTPSPIHPTSKSPNVKLDKLSPSPRFDAPVYLISFELWHRVVNYLHDPNRTLLALQLTCHNLHSLLQIPPSSPLISLSPINAISDTRNITTPIHHSSNESSANRKKSPASDSMANSHDKLRYHNDNNSHTSNDTVWTRVRFWISDSQSSTPAPLPQNNQRRIHRKYEKRLKQRYVHANILKRAITASNPNESASSPTSSFLDLNISRASSTSTVSSKTSSTKLSGHDKASMNFWKLHAIQRWAEMCRNPVLIRLWEREGIPDSCRSDVWPLAIGKDKDRNATHFRNRSHSVPTNPLNSAPSNTCTPYSKLNEGVEQNPIISRASNGTPSASPLPEMASPYNPEMSASRDVSDLTSGSLLDSPRDEPSESSQDLQSTYISNDLSRMFDETHLLELEDLCTLRSFEGDIFNSLQSFLISFSMDYPEISYVQGVSYIACLLLLYLPFDMAYCSFCYLLQCEYFPGFLFMRMDEMMERFQLFDQTLLHCASPLAQHFASLFPAITADTFLMDWLCTVFARTLPLSLCVRIFDGFLLWGELHMWRVAIAVLRILQPKLLKLDSSNILRMLRSSLVDYEEITPASLHAMITTVQLPNSIVTYFRKRSGSLPMPRYLLSSSLSFR